MCNLNFMFLITYCYIFEGCLTEKSWRYNVNIFNPANWVQNEDFSTCKGIIFTEDIPYTFTEELVTQRIVLPINGKIYINKIKFTDNPKCIKIGHLDYHSWFNPDSWYLGDNSAIPPTHRIPCRHDHVNIFEGLNSAIVIDLGYDVYVKSMTFKNTNITDMELQYLIEERRDWFVTENGIKRIFIRNEECEEDGCLCHSYTEELAICAYIMWSTNTVAMCDDPIIDTCESNSMCGARILFTPLPGFNLERFKKTIPRVPLVDTYASKVTPDGIASYIQVMFAPNSQSDSYADTIETAKEFYQQLAKEENMAMHKIHAPKLQMSGPPKKTNEKLEASVSVVFGTLLGVLTFFLIIYVFYVGPLKNTSVASRFSIQRRPLGTFHPFSAVRYDNKEEERLMFERQSIAGSVLSLERSFDNPMYGKPSTSSTSTLESILNEQKWEETHSARENPMFEMDTREEAIENIK